jgi:hypothetical protein
MVYVISPRDGPRREDVEARRVIADNRATIEKLADHLTGGGWRQRLRPPAAPAEAPRSTRPAVPSRSGAPQPYVRISVNGRVVVVDLASGRQIAFLGEVRGGREGPRFVLATAENGFFSPLADEESAALRPLDGTPLPDEAAEERLKAAVAGRLGFDGSG